MSSADGAAPTGPGTAGVRLQKVLAAAGVASRRASEELIAAGRVRVNGATVTEQGRRVDPALDRVEVDGRPVQVDVGKRYVILNKPVGVVSTLHDEDGRPDLAVFAGRYPERLFNVGRLDAATSGLLLLTNDGELAHVLMHPSFGVEKTYVARVRGAVTPRVVARLTAGIDLDDGPIAADTARLLQTGGGESLVEVSLHSGRNRIVRRMFAAVGHPVLGLVRRSFGPLALTTLPAGQTREATRAEVSALLALARDAHDEGSRGGRGRRDGGEPAPRRARRPASGGYRGRGGKKPQRHRNSRRPGRTA
ncbi:MAG TPA: pseudouridine synthase [Microbacteriaceae bacterium]|nr:pseudouridine synthase [Microbacteriaceae bacterium]